MSSGTAAVASKMLSPVSHQESSKVSPLDHATTHIEYLEMTQLQLQTRPRQAEDETACLRQCVISLSTIDRSTHVIHVGSTRR